MPRPCLGGEGPAEPREGTALDAAARVVEAVVTDGIYLLTAPLRLDRETAILTGGLTLSLTGLLLADREIRERVQAATGPTGRDAADGVTAAGDAGVVFSLNGVLLALGFAQQYATGETRLRNASLVALEAQFFTGLFTRGLKRLTGRARPDAGQGAHHFDPFEGEDALPSGHASRTFAVAAVFADRYASPVPVLAYGAAGLVAVERGADHPAFQGKLPAPELDGQERERAELGAVAMFDLGSFQADIDEGGAADGRDPACQRAGHDPPGLPPLSPTFDARESRTSGFTWTSTSWTTQ